MTPVLKHSCKTMYPGSNNDTTTDMLSFMTFIGTGKHSISQKNEFKIAMLNTGALVAG